MRSIPPADYAGLPKLRHPAAYIFVIRDVDSDRYRIQATNHPRSLVEAALAERTREFGIELLSILEADNIAESEARLYERHHATLGEQWLDLDAYQLRALQNSELQVYAFHSHYISRPPAPVLKPDPPLAGDKPPRQGRVLHSARRGKGVGAPRATLPPVQSAPEVESEHSKPGIRQAIDDAITDLWTTHPWKCLAALALVVLFCLATFDWSCNPHGGCPDTRSTSTNRPIQPAPSTQQSAASSGLAYRVLRAVTARECPAPNCAAISRLPAGTEIRSSGMVQGGDVDGSAAWIRFRRDGKTAYVPRSHLSLNR